MNVVELWELAKSGIKIHNAVMSMAYALTVGGVAALQSGASKVQEIPPSEIEEGPFLTVAEVSFLN